MSLLLIIISAVELEKNFSNFALSSISIFLKTKVNVVTNLKPFHWVNNSISLLLIADSVPLSCNSVLKEYKRIYS